MLMAKAKGHVWCWSPWKYATYILLIPNFSLLPASLFNLVLGMGLWDGLKWWLSKRYIHPDPVKVTGFFLGKGIFAGITMLRIFGWQHSWLTQWTLNPMIHPLIRKKEKTHREAMWRLKWCTYKPRSTKKCQQPPESSREAGRKFFLRNSLLRTSSARSWILDFWS